MGRAVATDLVPLTAQQSSDERAGRAFAIRTRDGNHQRSRPCQAKPLHHRSDPVQAHVYGSGMQLLEIGEPVGQTPTGHAVAVTWAGSTGLGNFCLWASKREKRVRS